MITKPKRLTLADLARHAGLDPSSVSLALRGSSKVSARTRERVRDLARRLGYRPNLAARRLASAAPQTVALVLPAAFATLASAAASATIRALACHAGKAGLLFQVVSIDDLLRAVRGEESAMLLPDGVLAWGDCPAEALAALRGAELPYVVLDPHHPSHAGSTGLRVEVDNLGGARHMVEHLLARGAARLLFVQGETAHLGHDARGHGTREAWLRARPLETFRQALLEEITDRDLTAFARQEAAAVFASNDACAFRLWHRLQRAGLSVPGDVKLCGFDGEPYGELLGLTTLAFDAEALGGAALDLLRRAWEEGASDETVRIPVALCPGATTGEPRDAPVKSFFDP